MREPLLVHMQNLVDGKAICGELIAYPDHLWTPHIHEVTCAKCIPLWKAERIRKASDDKCDLGTGYHSSPHKGCILR
jgi:hypothetical protein